MKTLLPLLLLAFVLGTLGTRASTTPVELPRQWRLVFEDEFDDGELDTNKWRKIEHEPGYKSLKSIPDWRRYQAQDAELYELNRPSRGTASGDDKHLPAAKGMLTLWGKQGTQFMSHAKTSGFLEPDALTYACGGIDTLKTFAFQYGYVEVRARFDSAAGVWPAIWMKPRNGRPWPTDGEIDIMEHLNHEDVIYQTLHYLANDGKRKINGKGVSSRQWAQSGKGAWHTYGMLWEKGSITFFVDGKQTGRLTAEGSTHWPFDRRNNAFFLIIDQQIGGSWVQGALGGRPMADLQKSPAAFDIDYVRVYSSAKYRVRR